AALQATQARSSIERCAAVSAAIAGWREALIPSARNLLSEIMPDAIVTSFFGTCIGSQLSELSGTPWIALNSTFYIGPDPPRPLERDFSARAADIFKYSVVPYLGAASLVLHATDRRFDYDHRNMPPNHSYTGPL